MLELNIRAQRWLEDRERRHLGEMIIKQKGSQSSDAFLLNEIKNATTFSHI